MKLVWKLAIPQIIVVVCFGLISFIVINASFSSMRQHYVEDTIESRFRYIETEIERSAKQSVSESSMFVSLPVVIEAYEIALSGNIDDPYSPQSQQAREMLRQELSPMLNSYSEFMGKDLELHFHLPNNFSLVRVWRELNTRVDGQWIDISDDLSSYRPTVVETNETGLPTLGLEPGSGGFAIRGVIPVVAPDGKQLGSMESLQLFNPILESATEADRIYIALYANKELLDFSVELQDEAKYPPMGDYVRVIPSQNGRVQSLITEEFLSSGAESSQFLESGNFALATYPLRDYQGNQVGIIVCAMDTTEVTVLANGATIVLVLMLMCMIVIPTFVLLYLLRRLVSNPVNKIRRKIKDIAQDRANLTEKVPVKQKDEIGDLAKWFNTLTTKLNGILHERQEMVTKINSESEKFEAMAHWYGTILDSIPFPISVQDADLKWVFVNSALEKVLGQKREEALGMPCSSWGISICNTNECAIACARRGQRQTFFMFEGVPYRVDVEALKDLRGEITGYIEVIQDMTIFEQLTRRQIEATAASEAKSSFLANMSHEIRTPLNAIIGMIGIGMTTDDVEKKNYCFERADGASKHLLGVINDILDMSKIEAGKFELYYSKFDFEKMLINITNVINIRAEEKHLNFVINCRSNVPSVIEGDELHLSQVITNLLSNAIKFTPENGTIILDVDKIEENGDEIVLRFEVLDTGIGISEEQQAMLFESFRQADVTISREFGGTGLGLAISKQIVEMMDGEISVESELGKGSKFIFTIKAKQYAEKVRTELSKNINPEKIRALLVDDSAEARRSFLQIMQASKLSSTVAVDGAEALEKIKNAKENPFNIVFVDWLLSDMDGIALAEDIKAISSDISIVIMSTVSGWNTIEKEAAAAGINLVISKPLLPSPLINAINTCLGQRQNGVVAQASESIAEKSLDLSKYSLLVVEDIEVNREIVRAMLEDNGVTLTFAENGEEAVALFSRGTKEFDLVLMDINMPKKDGYQATEEIRAIGTDYAKNVPIIAMTANVFREDVERCLVAGMNDHLGKPINLEGLYKILQKYL